jgi:DNA replication protein DnaC
MSATDDLVPVLKKLRLSGILLTLALRLRQAMDDNLAHEEFLFRLLSDEVERRDAKQLQLRMRRAAFEQHRTLEDFNFAFNPDIPKNRIIDLATGTFIERHENVLLCGKAGVGKSHLGQAIGHRACRAGYSVVFCDAHRMFRELRAARADDSYERKLQRFTTSTDLLIIDDLWLRPLAQGEPEDLHEIVRRRYERGATIITSNRAVDEWLPLFGDPLLASATIDRLLHHAHVIDLEGDSYRNPPPEKQSLVIGATRSADSDDS